MCHGESRRRSLTVDTTRCAPSRAALFIAKAKLRHAETQLVAHNLLDARSKAGLGYLDKQNKVSTHWQW